MKVKLYQMTTVNFKAVQNQSDYLNMRGGTVLTQSLNSLLMTPMGRHIRILNPSKPQSNSSY